RYVGGPPAPCHHCRSVACARCALRMDRDDCRLDSSNGTPALALPFGTVESHTVHFLKRTRLARHARTDLFLWSIWCVWLNEMSQTRLSRSHLREATPTGGGFFYHLPCGKLLRQFRAHRTVPASQRRT